MNWLHDSSDLFEISNTDNFDFEFLFPPLFMFICQFWVEQFSWRQSWQIEFIYLFWEKWNLQRGWQSGSVWFERWWRAFILPCNSWESNIQVLLPSQVLYWTHDPMGTWLRSLTLGTWGLPLTICLTRCGGFSCGGFLQWGLVSRCCVETSEGFQLLSDRGI